MSSTNTAVVAMQSSARATGDEAGRNCVRRVFAAAKLRNGVPQRRRLAKSRLRSARPPHCGLEFMFEAQVKVQCNGLGGTDLSLAGGRTSYACGARGFRAVPATENRTGLLASRPCGAARLGVPVPMRFANGQQNADRRDPPRGDPGGGFARQSRRRIRL